LSLAPSTLNFSKDGTLLLIGSEVPEDTTQNEGYVAIDVWDLKTRSLLKCFSNKLLAKKAIQSVKLVHIDAENKRVFSAHNTFGGIQGWDMDKPTESISALNLGSSVYIHD